MSQQNYCIFAMGLALIAIFLGGCGTKSLQSDVAQVATSAPPDQASPSAVIKKKVPSISSIEQSFLSRAENHTKQYRFLPEDGENNAYDLYHSVLLINPDNKQAKAGLNSILVSESGKVRRLISLQRITEAKKTWKRLDRYFPNEPLVSDLQKAIQGYRPPVQEVVAEIKPQVLATADYREIDLDHKGLSAKSEDIIKQLQDIAKELVETDESVLIIARNDSEGRWIYKQMRSAVSGYRVRGDIRYGKTAKIRVLPPI